MGQATGPAAAQRQSHLLLISVHDLPLSYPYIDWMAQKQTQTAAPHGHPNPCPVRQGVPHQCIIGTPDQSRIVPTVP
ncbi:MAG: hypothetical protein KDE58_30225, partial [Caldilineaceae bacterium]|nr:hypothetical protein [Caldilineaceae bacterium]